MRVEFYGLTFETPKVSFYLWSPWRATTLEHRLFEVVTHPGKANLERLTADRGNVHGTILSIAADCNIDLMVMGGYGHSRLQEQGSPPRSHPRLPIQSQSKCE